jgi:uncharacterized protein (DUF58 family)
MPPPDARWSVAASAGATAAAGFVLARPERLAGPSGEVIGAGVGQSIEFMDFRDYEPGDDLRRIDWSAYARSDRLVVRRHRQDVRPTVEIFVDASRSMDLPGTVKADAAVALAAALVSAARRGGSSAGLFATGASGGAPVPALEHWPGFDDAPAAAPRISRGDRAASAGSVRVLISDMLFRADLDDVIRRAARGARWAVLLHLLAREDTAAPELGPLRLRDVESGSLLTLEIDAAAQAAFTSRLTAFLASCRSACARAKVSYVPLIAQDLYDGSFHIDALLRAGVLTPR